MSYDSIFIAFQTKRPPKTRLCLFFMYICSTGAKPALGPNCMIPYIKNLYIWYHTVGTQSRLGPCNLYVGFAEKKINKIYR